MESTLKRTWAEIRLDALENNYKKLRDYVGEKTKFLGVVKADAYGHGSVLISRKLQELGADYLAVSSVDEAMELRENGISMPILILGHTPKEQVKNLVKLDITQAVTCHAKAVEYSREASSLDKPLKIHVKVDTGMSRLGYLCDGNHFEGGVSSITEDCQLPGLEVEGIFTHFAVSDEKDPDSVAYTKEQFRLFKEVITAVENKLRFQIPIHHCANSGAVVNYPETYWDMVRPGILLYGCTEDAKKIGLEPVMTLKTTVSTIKTYEEGTSISYGRIYKTARTTRIGVLPYGYADGFLRSLSNQCALYTKDGMAKQCGKICMDMCMIDLTDLPNVQVGDEVEIFGKNSSINELARLAGTIPYELTCAVSKRVPRLYFEKEKMVDKELLLRF